MTEERKFYGWKLVAVLWILYFINVAFPYYGASVVNASMAKALSLDKVTLGLGFTVITLCWGLPGPLVALFLNKKGVRLSMFLGSLTITLGALLMALVVSKGWQYVLVFGVVIGVSLAFSTAIPAQTGVTLWFTRKRALALSIVMTSAGIGGFVAVPLLNKIIDLAQGNWTIAWFFTAAMSVVAAIVAILFVKNKPSDLGQVPDGISKSQEAQTSTEAHAAASSRVYRAAEDWKTGDAVRTRVFWFILVAAVCFAWPVIITVAHGVIHLKELGHAPDTCAMAIGLLTLSSLGGRLLAGSIGDHLEPRYIWAIAMLLSTAGLLILLKATSDIQVYLFAIILGLGYGASYICWPALVGNYFGANAFASILGTQTPITTLAIAPAPLIAGWVYDLQGSYHAALLLTAALSTLGAVLVFFAKPPTTAKTV